MNSAAIATDRYPHLFTPLRLAGVELPNRACLTATLTNLGRDTRITPPWLDFHIQRALGGTAMIVTEGVAVDANAVAHPAVVAAFDDANADGFRRLADGVHAAGGAVVAQLWHAGRQQLWHPTRSPQGVSDQPDAYSWTVPHVMDDAEIERVIAAFVDVAQKMARCGLDGVELHGAHGYLITQFLSPWSNDRHDRFGGSLENRCRFAASIAKGIREKCGTDFVIGIKMPADEGIDGGIDVSEAERITRYLRDHQLFDYFAYSQGNFSISLENHVPDMHFDSGHFLDMHRRLRIVADGVPVMALGRIDCPSLAERVVADGYGDLVGMCRALVADASFMNKAANGADRRIRPSLYDNVCWGVIHSGRPIAEAQNPELAQPFEATWTPRPASRAASIAVLGSGPAALEVGWRCAARGHRVKLIATGDRVGGKLKLEANLPGHSIVSRLVDYQRDCCDDNGVEFLFGERGRIDAKLVREFDHVVVATGSTMRRLPDLEVTGNLTIQSLHDFARNLSTTGGPPANAGADSFAPRGRTAMVIDQDHSAPVYAAAIALASRYEHVVLVTSRPNVAQGVNYCSSLGILRRLYGAGVELTYSVEVKNIRDDEVTVANVFSGKTLAIQNVDILVYATPRRVNLPTHDDELIDCNANGDLARIHYVGDCRSPRNLMIAIHEAQAIAERIGEK